MLLKQACNNINFCNFVAIRPKRKERVTTWVFIYILYIMATNPHVQTQCIGNFRESRSMKYVKSSMDLFYIYQAVIHINFYRYEMINVSSKYIYMYQCNQCRHL